MTEQDKAQLPAAFNVAKKYVRAGAEREDGFVEFEFAIGDPALFVELMLPADSFKEFCESNDVVVLDEALDVDAGDWAARLNQASQREIGEE